MTSASLRGGNGDAIHVLIHDAAGRLVQSRRIDQHQLRVRAIHHAEDAMPGGLRLGVTMVTLRPTRAFTSVDLPTLGRPTMATMPARKGAPLMGLAHFGRQQIQHLARRQLLGAPPAAALAHRHEPERGHLAGDRERLRVRISRHGGQGIHRQARPRPCRASCKRVFASFKLSAGGNFPAAPMMRAPPPLPPHRTRIQERSRPPSPPRHPPVSRPGESRRISIRPSPAANALPSQIAAICARVSPLTRWPAAATARLRRRPDAHRIASAPHCN
jgi:hypothetical protein